MSPSGDLSKLPSVERVRAALGASHPHEVIVGAARRAVDLARADVRDGAEAPELETVVASARELLAEHDRSQLVPVINATGVLLHTNLGRAPLGTRQLEAVARVAGGYSNLEFDLTTGVRGSRYVHAQGLLRTLTGAEAALVVNNNAAAVLVTLAAMCAGREVIISRGELVEIGGEFRVPDILEASGARLVEVGTTNRTHLADYEKAITPDTAAILRVHPSNYTVVGFTSAVGGRDLGRLAKGRRLLFIHDVGSGLLDEAADMPDGTREPTVRASLEDGADIVTFSGDKLLGGPQTGVMVGRKQLLDRVSRHPMMRALRVDKMTLAALEETLRIYLEGATEEIPLQRAIGMNAEVVEQRAHSLLVELRLADDVKAEVVAHRAVAGGGAMPGAEIRSFAISIAHSTRSAAEVARSLRHGTPAVIGVVEDDRLLVDLRTVTPEQEGELRAALERTLA